ncbi:sterol carrier protein 2 [Mortierella sp. AD011]|nr:sterol carrier protein 2 [Mortierella sp. AD011]
MATDSPKLFNESSIELAGADMTRRAASDVYTKAGIKPSDVQVVELHDCFSANELITYDALGLCKPGEAHKLLDSKDVTFGGKYVVNPSGGLISKGHPLGATGLAQCSELVWQLRGWCGERQADLGSSPKYVDSRKRVGYNPAVEAREVSDEEVASVCAKESSEFMARL